MRGVLALLVLAALAACGGDMMMNSSCPADEPASCPASGAPSYGSDVAPLIAKYCMPCHNSTGSAADQPLFTYDDLYARRADVLDQLYQCIMPLSPAPDPTDTERVTILTWLVCDAPNN